jgi:hypothetical protein
VLYERADDVQHDSDHYPIRSIYNINTAPKPTPQHHNWAATDNKALGEYLNKHLVIPNLTNASKTTVELTTVAFLSIIRHVIEASTP